MAASKPVVSICRKAPHFTPPNGIVDDLRGGALSHLYPGLVDKALSRPAEIRVPEADFRSTTTVLLPLTTNVVETPGDEIEGYRRLPTNEETFLLTVYGSIPAATEELRDNPYSECGGPLFGLYKHAIHTIASPSFLSKTRFPTGLVREVMREDRATLTEEKDTDALSELNRRWNQVMVEDLCYHDSALSDNFLTRLIALVCFQYWVHVHQRIYVPIDPALPTTPIGIARPPELIMINANEWTIRSEQWKKFLERDLLVRDETTQEPFHPFFPTPTVEVARALNLAEFICLMYTRLHGRDKMPTISHVTLGFMANPTKDSTLVEWMRNRPFGRWVCSRRLYLSHLHLFSEAPVYQMHPEFTLARQLVHLLQRWVPVFPEHGHLTKLKSLISTKNSFADDSFLMMFCKMTRETDPSVQLTNFTVDQLQQWWIQHAECDGHMPFDPHAISFEMLHDPLIAPRLHQLIGYTENIEAHNGVCREEKRQAKHEKKKATNAAATHVRDCAALVFMPPARVRIHPYTMPEPPPPPPTPPSEETEGKKKSKKKATPPPPPAPRTLPPAAPHPLSPYWVRPGHLLRTWQRYLVPPANQLDTTLWRRDAATEQVVEYIRVCLNNGGSDTGAHQQMGWPQDLHLNFIDVSDAWLKDDSDSDDDREPIRDGSEQRRNQVMVWLAYAFFRVLYAWPNRGVLLSRVHLALYTVYQSMHDLRRSPAEIEAPSPGELQEEYLTPLANGFLTLFRLYETSLQPVLAELTCDPRVVAAEYKLLVQSRNKTASANEAVAAALPALGLSIRQASAADIFRPVHQRRRGLVILRDFMPDTPLQAGDTTETLADSHRGTIQAVLKAFLVPDHESAVWKWLESQLFGYWNAWSRSDPQQLTLTRAMLDTIHQFYRDLGEAASPVLSASPTLQKFIQKHYDKYTHGFLDLHVLVDGDSPCDRLPGPRHITNIRDYEADQRAIKLAAVRDQRRLKDVEEEEEDDFQPVGRPLQPEAEFDLHQKKRKKTTASSSSSEGAKRQKTMIIHDDDDDDNVPLALLSQKKGPAKSKKGKAEVPVDPPSKAKSKKGKAEALVDPPLKAKSKKGKAESKVAPPPPPRLPPPPKPKKNGKAEASVDPPPPAKSTESERHRPALMPTGEFQHIPTPYALEYVHDCLCSTVLLPLLFLLHQVIAPTAETLVIPKNQEPIAWPICVEVANAPHSQRGTRRPNTQRLRAPTVAGVDPDQRIRVLLTGAHPPLNRFVSYSATNRQVAYAALTELLRLPETEWTTARQLEAADLLGLFASFERVFTPSVPLPDAQDFRDSATYANERDSYHSTVRHKIACLSARVYGAPEDASKQLVTRVAGAAAMVDFRDLEKLGLLMRGLTQRLESIQEPAIFTSLRAKCQQWINSMYQLPPEPTQGDDLYDQKETLLNDQLQAQFNDLKHTINGLLLSMQSNTSSWSSAWVETGIPKQTFEFSHCRSTKLSFSNLERCVLATLDAIFSHATLQGVGGKPLTFTQLSTQSHPFTRFTTWLLNTHPVAISASQDYQVSNNQVFSSDPVYVGEVSLCQYVHVSTLDDSWLVLWLFNFMSRCNQGFMCPLDSLANELTRFQEHPYLRFVPMIVGPGQEQPFLIPIAPTPITPPDMTQALMPPPAPRPVLTLPPLPPALRMDDDGWRNGGEPASSSYDPSPRPVTRPVTEADVEEARLDLIAHLTQSIQDREKKQKTSKPKPKGKLAQLASESSNIRTHARTRDMDTDPDSAM